MSNDPLKAFAAATDALARGEWLRAAACCDPESLAAFKAGARRRHDPDALAEARTVSPDDYLSRDPAMPRQVAEYLAAQHRSRPSPAAELRAQFPGFATFQQLADASDPEVFAAWLRGRSLRHELEKEIARSALPPEHAAAVLEEAAAEYRFRVIGWLPEGERLAHVLFRPMEEDSSPAGDTEATVQGEGEYEAGFGTEAEPLIATCRRQPDGTWLLLASFTFLRRGGEWFVMGVDAEDESAPDQAEA